MLTSKQRAELKSLAANMQPLFQVGKGGIGDALIKQVDDALTCRELIKLSANETVPESVEDIARVLAEATGSQVVQVIGRKMIFYRKNPKLNKIKLGK